jgi:hypothetical protein
MFKRKVNTKTCGVGWGVHICNECSVHKEHRCLCGATVNMQGVDTKTGFHWNLWLFRPLSYGN